MSLEPRSDAPSSMLNTRSLYWRERDPSWVRDDLEPVKLCVGPGPSAIAYYVGDRKMVAETYEDLISAMGINAVGTAGTSHWRWRTLEWVEGESVALAYYVALGFGRSEGWSVDVDRARARVYRQGRRLHVLDIRDVVAEAFERRAGEFLPRHVAEALAFAARWLSGERKVALPTFEENSTEIDGAASSGFLPVANSCPETGNASAEPAAEGVGGTRLRSGRRLSAG